MERIQAIRLFVRIVDLGSFSKAAAEMRIGQPAATKQIGRMEAQLGARLLYRSTRGVSPTEIGLRYYEKCKLISQHVEEAESVSALLQTQLQGALKISTSVAFGRRIMASLTMQFMDMNPGLQVELHCDDSYVNLIEQGIDVAIRMGRLADSGLGSRHLGLNPWTIVAAPAYLQEHGTPVSPQDLGKHAALIYSTVQGDARWQLSGAKGKSVSVAVRGALRSNNLSMLLMAARKGMGIAAVPRYVAHESLKTGALVSVLDDWQLPQQEIHAVFPSPRMLPAKVTQFIAWLEGQFDQDWWARNYSA